MLHRIAGTKARLPLQSPDLDATEAMHPLAVLFGFATKIADFFVEKPESFRNMLSGNTEQLARKMLQRQNFQPVLATARQHQSSLLASSPAGGNRVAKHKVKFMQFMSRLSQWLSKTNSPKSSSTSAILELQSPQVFCKHFRTYPSRTMWSVKETRKEPWVLDLLEMSYSVLQNSVQELRPASQQLNGLGTAIHVDQLIQLIPDRVNSCYHSCFQLEVLPH